MGVEERMFATKKTLSMLFLCTFCTFLAALEVRNLAPLWWLCFSFCAKVLQRVVDPFLAFSPVCPS